jgi:quercetin dioxygenase-like cupin family protein
MNCGAVRTLLRTTTNSVGQPIAYPREGTPEVAALAVEMAPGEETGWHRHPVPLLGYLLAGELTVYQASGEKRVVGVGEISLESVDVFHNGVNEGAEPLKMIVFVAGLKDVAFTEESGDHGPAIPAPSPKS